MWRAQKQRRRQRERAGEGVASFRFNADRLGKLIDGGYLAESAADDLGEIGRAIERLIDAVDL